MSMNSDYTIATANANANTVAVTVAVAIIISLIGLEPMINMSIRSQRGSVTNTI